MRLLLCKHTNIQQKKLSVGGLYMSVYYYYVCVCRCVCLQIYADEYIDDDDGSHYCVNSSFFFCCRLKNSKKKKTHPNMQNNIRLPDLINKFLFSIHDILVQDILDIPQHLYSIHLTIVMLICVY